MKKFAILAALATTPTFAVQPVSINFAAEIGGQPFACDATYADLGSTGAVVRGTDFRLYVSDVAMIAADGSRVPATLDESDWQKAIGNMQARRCWISRMAAPPAPMALRR
jgi:hypothetical protein